MKKILIMLFATVFSFSSVVVTFAQDNSDSANLKKPNLNVNFPCKTEMDALMKSQGLPTGVPKISGSTPQANIANIGKPASINPDAGDTKAPKININSPEAKAFEACMKKNGRLGIPKGISKLGGKVDSSSAGSPTTEDYSTLDICTNTPITKRLSIGSTGPQVYALQNFLIKENLLGAGSAVGTYGKATAKAIKTWQTNNSIKVSGEVGPNTKTSIMATCKQ